MGFWALPPPPLAPPDPRDCNARLKICEIDWCQRSTGTRGGPGSRSQLWAGSQNHGQGQDEGQDEGKGPSQGQVQGQCQGQDKWQREGQSENEGRVRMRVKKLEQRIRDEDKRWIYMIECICVI